MIEYVIYTYFQAVQSPKTRPNQLLEGFPCVSSEVRFARCRTQLLGSLKGLLPNHNTGTGAWYATVCQDFSYYNQAKV